VPSYQLLSVDSTYTEDSLAAATIAPYREQMANEMDVVIGYADQRLVEREVESILGNFVTDAILTQSKRHYSGKIDMSIINNGGLRAPIPEGDIKISTIYELMPFENFLYIVELNGSQTKAMFDLLATSKRLAIANSVVLVENDQVEKIFIGGAPFNNKETYVLAVSDYLANGGGGMEFLKEARIVKKTEVKVRDLIIDHITWLEENGQSVDAKIEGRVKLMQ
jgi:2',3'-cyclic-nucleotide 2'-phosphodiesterase (5'-nucleotidase family)